MDRFTGRRMMLQAAVGAPVLSFLEQMALAGGHKPNFKGPSIIVAQFNEQTGNKGICTIDLKAREINVLVDFEGKDGAPELSRDGQRLYFETERFDTEARDIAVLDMKTGDIRNLSGGVSWKLSNPAVSYDGNYVAAVASIRGFDRIALMNADGTNKRVLPVTTIASSEGRVNLRLTNMPAFTHDGTALLYHGQVSRKEVGLFAVPVTVASHEIDAVTRLTMGEWDSGPIVSSKGDVYFLRSAVDNPDEVESMHVMKAKLSVRDDGRLSLEKIKQISRKPGAINYLALSPDERHLVFSQRVDNRYQLFICNTSERRFKRVKTPWSTYHPSWGLKVVTEGKRGPKRRRL